MAFSSGKELRRAARVDANQGEIVDGLRQIGCSVAITSSLGSGFPDLCVGSRGRNSLLEIKQSGVSPSKRALTEDEAKWHADWKGQVATVEGLQEAIKVVRTDQSVYRQQRSAMIHRETGKIALVADPTPDGYTVTVNNGKSVIELQFQCSDHFEAMNQILKYADTLT